PSSVRRLARSMASSPHDAVSSNRRGYPSTITRACGAWLRIAAYVWASLAGRTWVAYARAALTATVHAPSVPSRQVVTTSTKPASLPPTVMVTRVVVALSAPTWLLSTSVVVAPPQATNVKLVTLWPAAQSAGYDRELREQPLESYPPAPRPAEYESPSAAYRIVPAAAAGPVTSRPVTAPRRAAPASATRGGIRSDMGDLRCKGGQLIVTRR